MCVKKHISIVFILCYILLFLSACGRTRDNQSEDTHSTAQPSVEGTVPHERPLRAALPRHIITGTRANILGIDMATELRGEGIDFNLDITTLPDSQFEQGAFLERLGVELMAGIQSYDILGLQPSQLFRVAERGFLADINEIIDRTTIYDREGFFSNILNSLEIDGNLYFFPISFRIMTAGINARLPQEYLERFAQMSSINIHEMLEIQNKLHHSHPEYANLYVFHQFSVTNGGITPLWMFLLEASNYVDLNTSRANFIDNRMISFLENFTLIFDRPSRFDDASGLRSDVRHGAINIEQGIFTIHGNSTFAESFFSVENPYFIYNIPFVGNDGGVYANIFDSFSILRNADYDLAWNFITRMFHENNEGLTYYFPIIFSTYRPVFESQWRRTLRYAASRDGTNRSAVHFMQPIIDSDIPGIIDAQIDSAVERLAETLSLLILMYLDSRINIYDLIYDIYDLFVNYVISAHEAANMLQNRITLWLIE